MLSLKKRIIDDMKSAMRAKNKERLMTIRLVLAVIKQQEVDTQEVVDDQAVLAILDKQVKQRRDSIAQYDKAGRDDLADQERKEMAILQEYLPEQLTDSEIDALIQQALDTTGASAMSDMGKVMGFITPKAKGRADMGKISGLIKSRLS
ncbi:MAG TPA: GatB/YqeY domain-containing protein [Thiothrix sp.]|nr:GatB/YqeY domain-containing protein [Thiothrix sp.]